MYISTFSINYNLFHKYKYYTYSNFNKKIIAKHLLSKYRNIKRNKIKTNVCGVIIGC